MSVSSPLPIDSLPRKFRQMTISSSHSASRLRPICSTTLLIFSLFSDRISRYRAFAPPALKMKSVQWLYGWFRLRILPPQQICFLRDALSDSPSALTHGSVPVVIPRRFCNACLDFFLWLFVRYAGMPGCFCGNAS